MSSLNEVKNTLTRVNVIQYHMSKRDLAGTDESYIRKIATFISMVKENKSFSILFYSKSRRWVRT